MMAASNRSERQLMRQRGAGVRNPTNVDFGLDFHAGREERQLMRQRGAGNRNVDKVDFGFLIAPSDISRRSRSKTPQTSIQNKSRSSRTPSRTSRETSLPKSTKRQFRQSSVDGRAIATPANTESLVEHGSKRRKISHSGQAMSARGKQERPLQALQQGPAATRQSTNSLDGQAEPQPRDQTQSYPYLPDQTADKENEGLVSDIRRGGNSPGKRTPLEGSSQPYGEAQEESIIPSVETSVVGFAEDDINDMEDDDTHARPPRSLIDHQNTHPQAKPSDRSANKAGPRRRKKRKSVVLIRKKRRSSGNTTLSTNADPEDIAEGGRTGNQDGSSLEEARSTTARHASRDTQQDVDEDQDVAEAPWEQSREDEDADETYMPDDASPEPTPAPKRQRIMQRQQISRDRSSSERVERRMKSSFPVLTHRMTNIGNLPTISEIDEHDDNDNDDSIERLPAAFSNRIAPNGVEVLAQICRESVATAISKIESQAAPGIGRAELKRKRAALEAFGVDLNDRLFEMSEAVEQRSTLESRLRKSKREKTELQARWIEVRRQREQLALRSDAIRRQHWEDEERAKQSWEISEAAMKAEMELDRADGNEDEQQESLEFMLRSLTAHVSCRSNEGGILAKVRSFNSQLENLATALERR